MYNRVLLSSVAVSVAVAWGGAISHGATGTLADPSGQIVPWGDNSSGQLNVPAGINATSVSAGFLHSVALKADHSLAAWGDGSLNKTKVPTSKNFVAISAGGSHTSALRTDGSLAGWGDGTYGQLSLPGGKTFVAVAAGGGHNVALRSDGTVAASGFNSFGQATAPFGNQFRVIAAGSSHNVAIMSDKSLFVWGGNPIYGLTAVPAGKDFVAVSAGGNHSLALTSEGKLVGWGEPGAGDKLKNDIPTEKGFVAVSSGLLHNIALRSDGSVVAWGDNSKKQTDVPQVGGLVAISAGGYHNLALVGRSVYDGDLLVAESGMKSNLNRSVNVAGDMIVSTQVTFFNNPTAIVAGKLRVSPGMTLSGNGALSANGIELQGGTTGNGLTLGDGVQAVQVVSSGPIGGNGSLTVSAGSYLDVSMAAGSAWSGNLNLPLNGAVSFNGTGVQTAGALTSGSATNPGPAVAGGRLTTGPGQRLRFTSTAAPTGTPLFPSTNYNGGLIEVAGNLDGDGASEIEFLGAITNSVTGPTSTGLITGRDAVMKFSGGLTNNGALTLTRGANDVFGKITNNAGATIAVTGGATATFYGDIVQNGTFRVAKVGSTTSTAVFLGSYSGGGIIGGGDVFMEGDLRPGNSPASVTFDGNLGLGSWAGLDIELAGTTPGSQYDQVSVAGNLSLGGALNVKLLDGFVPTVGNSFDILNWGTLSGAFASISLPAIGSGLAWDASQLYTSGVLSVVSAGVPGDYNSNGVVDAADYVTWRKNQGPANGLAGASTGGTNGAEYSQWRDHFGGQSGGGAGIGGAAVPEPASVTAIVIAAALLAICGGRLGR